MRALDTGRLSHSRVAVVQGMAGIGKSLLAIFHAEQFDRAFSLGVEWMAVAEACGHRGETLSKVLGDLFDPPAEELRPLLTG